MLILMESKVVLMEQGTPLSQLLKEHRWGTLGSIASFFEGPPDAIVNPLSVTYSIGTKVGGRTTLSVKNELVRLYRGFTGKRDTIQMAGGLRSGKFTMEELESLKPSEIAERLGYKELAETYKEKELRYAIDEVRAMITVEGHPEFSLYLSATADKTVAMDY